MRLVAELWSVLTWPQRRRVLAAQAISLLMAASTVTGIAAIAPFFAVLGDPGLSERIPLLHWLYVHGGFLNPRRFVVALGVAFIGFVLLSNLINVLGFAAMTRLALRVGCELQASLFAEYLFRPYRFHTSTNGTLLFNNVVYETSRLTQGVLQHLFMLLTAVCTAALIILSILAWQPAIAVLMICALAGGYALIYLGVRKQLLSGGEAQSRFGTEQAQIVGESFGAIKEISILQAQSFFLRGFERASQALALAAGYRQFAAQSPRYLMECVAAAGLVSVALVLSARPADTGPLLGQLTFLAFAAFRLLPTLQQMFAALVRIRADRPGLARVAADLRLAHARRPPLAVQPESRCNRPWHDGLRHEIRLRDVSFRYAPDRPSALSGVTLRIPAGATAGIVGANGSGKTTLVDVIAGLLVPDAGRVELDGTALCEDNRTAWQSRVAYVPQHVYLLDASIAQNIALGVAVEHIDRSRLREVLRLAQLEDFLSTLPEGYHHRVGERGIRLSGGQRQRIGIARALYKHASILLLDEATSSQDLSVTEQQLVAMLTQLRGRYTSILIAHRLTTLRVCDVIFELQQGHIVGSGTYEELLRSSVTFRRMAGSR